MHTSKNLNQDCKEVLINSCGFRDSLRGEQGVSFIDMNKWVAPLPSLTVPELTGIDINNAALRTAGFII